MLLFSMLTVKKWKEQKKEEACTICKSLAKTGLLLQVFLLDVLPHTVRIETPTCPYSQVLLT